MACTSPAVSGRHTRRSLELSPRSVGSRFVSMMEETRRRFGGFGDRFQRPARIRVSYEFNQWLSVSLESFGSFVVLAFLLLCLRRTGRAGKSAKSLDQDCDHGDNMWQCT